MFKFELTTDDKIEIHYINVNHFKHTLIMETGSGLKNFGTDADDNEYLYLQPGVGKFYMIFDS